jgi:hypothetical protein
MGPQKRRGGASENACMHGGEYLGANSARGWIHNQKVQTEIFWIILESLGIFRILKEF